MNMRISHAIDALGDGPLTEQGILEHVAPLFSHVLANENVYLANHSLGRPLDRMQKDVEEATALWYTKLGHAWGPWLTEQEVFRSRIARLIGAPRLDCIVPKTSAGQGLRTVLNAMPAGLRVLSTRGEFDSIDVILKQYAALGRIEVSWIEADGDGQFDVKPLMEAVESGTRVDLVVVSQVMFMTGQILHGLDQLADACQRNGARLLVDAYHAIGVIPIDVTSMQADFMIGGSYKYLRGGPGACFLYVSPGVLEAGLRPLDTGWFANAEAFAYQRPDPPILRSGGDAFLESTPPVLTYYQARSGQQFLEEIGVDRLRVYSLKQLRRLRKYLADAGVESVTGGDEDHGAFLTIRIPNAMEMVAELGKVGIVCDARSKWLRLCPDCLTRDVELRRVAKALGRLLAT
jgi:kynureninase